MRRQEILRRLERLEALVTPPSHGRCAPARVIVLEAWGDVALEHAYCETCGYLRRAINALQGETAEALDLPGADVATFGERMARTEALLPPGERGMTGTGFVPN